MSILLGLLAAAIIGAAIVITLDYLNKETLKQEAKKVAQQYSNELGSNITAKLTQKEYNVFDLDLTGSKGKLKIDVKANHVEHSKELFSKMKL